MKNILERAGIFDRFLSLIGGGSRQMTADRYIRARPGDAVLDIGCGTAAILDFLPEIEYIGFDPSSGYIARARRRFGHRAEFYEGTCGTIALPLEKRFDLVLAIGVLHHVDDGEAISILRLAQSRLKPSGRFFSVDGCLDPSQPLLAKWLVRLDRGGHVRTEPAYRSLASQVFDDVSVEIQHHLLRIPYTHIFMQCSGKAAQGTS